MSFVKHNTDTLVIVDDHKMIVNGIASIVKKVSNIDLINILHNAQDLLAFLSNHKVDIVLLDISLPDINGIELCKIITLYYPNTTVIALSNYADLPLAHKMINNGAKGYIAKEYFYRDFKKALTHIKNGSVFFSKIITSQTAISTTST